MMASVRSILIAGVFVVAGASAQAQSLTETLTRAYDNSNLLEQNRALLRATDENAAQAMAAVRPLISASASAVYYDQTGYTDDNLSKNATLSAEMPLFTGGALKVAKDLAEETVMATRERLRAIEQQVLLNAALAFFNVRKADEVVELQRNYLGLIERELEASRDRFDVGAGTRTDVALAEAQLAAARSTLAAARGALANAREAYRAAVGQYPATLGNFGALPKPAASLEAAKAIARDKSPTIAEAQRNTKVADLNIRAAKAAYNPTVTLRGEVSRNDQDVTTSTARLTVNQTLYSGGQLDSLHRQAVAQSEASRSALLLTVINVEQGVGEAWSSLDVANASLAASGEQIRAAQLAYEGIREEASLGARTTLDVLDAEQSLLDAQTTRAAAVNDRYIAAYTLLASMGLLTVDALDLAVVRYDPAAYYESVKNAPLRTDRGIRLDKVLKSLGKK